MAQAATKDDVRKLGTTLRDEIRENTREIISHSNQSQGKQNIAIDNRFTKVDTQLLDLHTKLDAIMSGEVLVTRKQLERLLRALKAKGIELNEADILAA